MLIKVAFCVAYDWYFLNYSLPLIYKHADTICLAIDKDRISWAGNPFEFDELGFRELVTRVDVDRKIRVFEDDFHKPELAPMQNEVRQRNMMAAFMGSDDGWHIQLDSDEYFMDFGGFVNYLKRFNSAGGRLMNICCPWITMYKRIDEGFLMVQPSNFETIEFIPIATTKPHYEYGRRNGYFNHLTTYSILHQSWARTDEEVWQKLNNWGHKYDADIDAYFQLWKNANATNYTEYVDFNQANPAAWPRLFLLALEPTQSVVDIIQNGINLPVEIKRGDLMRKNSIVWSYWNALKRKLMRK